MPDVRNKETVDLIAEYYCTNGQNKTKALIETGYDDEYANSGAGHKIFKNVRVEKAIAEKMAELQTKKEYNQKIALSHLDAVIENLTPKARVGNIQANQAIITAIREKNACTGLHKQTITDKDLSAPEFTETERRAREKSACVYKSEIANTG